MFWYHGRPRFFFPNKQYSRVGAQLTENQMHGKKRLADMAIR